LNIGINTLYSDDASANEQMPPEFFYIIRTCMKPPCLALKIAFLGGIAGSVRNQVIVDIYS
jgi:hypothetical protein